MTGDQDRAAAAPSAAPSGSEQSQLEGEYEHDLQEYRPERMVGGLVVILGLLALLLLVVLVGAAVVDVAGWAGGR